MRQSYGSEGSNLRLMLLLPLYQLQRHLLHLLLLPSVIFLPRLAVVRGGHLGRASRLGQLRVGLKVGVGVCKRHLLRFARASVQVVVVVVVVVQVA